MHTVKQRERVRDKWGRGNKAREGKNLKGLRRSRVSQCKRARELGSLSADEGVTRSAKL